MINQKIFLLLLFLFPYIVSANEPGNYDINLEAKGLNRSYLVHVPPSYQESKKMPLILNFHGGGGKAEGHRRITQMNHTADKHGFIVVYPRGTKAKGKFKRKLSFWNVDPGPTGAFHEREELKNVNDVAFVNAMLNDLEGRFSIDKKKIYATGFSNGAILSHFLGCQLSERIAAIAPVSGPFWTEPVDCQLTRPIPVMSFHGDADTFAPFQGGQPSCEQGIQKPRNFPSVLSSVEIWREKNQCSKESRITYQNGDTTCITYDSCADDSEVTFCKIAGGGHT